MSSDINYSKKTRKHLMASVALALFFPINVNAQTSDAKARAATTSSSPKISPEEGCSKLYQRYVTVLQELWKRRGLNLKPENTDGYSTIEDLTPDHCKETESRNELIQTLARILNHHSGKIAIILPINKYPHLKIIISAFEAHAQSQGIDPKKTFLYYDTEEKDDKLHQALASSIFEHRVTAIIGGSEPKEAETLRSWGTKILVPTFILMDPHNTPPSPFVFYAHPTQKTLAHAAVEANLRFGHKKISILTPADQHSDKFVAAYTEKAKASGITILHQVSYDYKRFDLMEAAAKKIFRLDGTDRKDELKKLYETAKQHAKESGTKFNPKMVALQPDVQQDAVLIPDTFRIARHFAKIFVFLGVRKLPIFGHFEWRSVGLINPWDPFLGNAYFVDFQGLYSSFPDSIKLSNLESPFFVPNDKIELADFSILGWRAIATPLLLSQRKNEARRKLDRAVPRKTSNPNDVAFDQDNVMIGTGYLFRLGANGKVGGINLISPQ